MFKLFRYLGEHKAAVAAVIILLIVQAYCDLSLPSYTSDIVDVGIQQKGIVYAVPEVMRADTMDYLNLLLEEEETEKVKASYDLKEDGTYQINVKDKETLEELEGIVSLPMIMLLQMNESKEMKPETLKTMFEGGMLEKKQILEIRHKAEEQMADMSETMLGQMAALAVEGEYEACGVDIGKYQMTYLLKTGAKMLGLTLLMVVVAVAVGLIASRASAQIGRDLRGRVFDKVVSFSNKEINEFSTASLITRSTNDIQQVQMVSVMLLRMVIYAPIIGSGGIVKVARTDTGMEWIIAVAVVTIICIWRLYTSSEPTR
ncbi:MAG: ABC transporter ATP-binding protein, partial [Lachnospiraceae bacterium]|nr:ABC transporter ATP-binding protein [Lachnospiraceae bacterium]